MTQKRRRLLKTTGIAITGTVLTGCTGILNDNEDGASTSNTDPKPEYRVEVEPVKTEIDLTDLQNWNYEADSIRDQDYIELEVGLYQDQEPVNPDQIKLNGLTGQLEHDTEDSLQRIACTQLEPGTNTLTVEAEKNGNQDTTEIEVEKNVPRQYLIEAYVDNDRITEHETPYSFDTHQLDTQKFQEERQKAVKDRARQKVVENFNPREIEDIQTRTKEGEIELIDTIGRYVREEIGRHSGHAQLQAATEEQIIHKYTDYQPHQVRANGFNNPASQLEEIGGAHGSKAIHLDGDWYHHETIGPEVKHIDDIEETDMVSGIVNPEFVSILGEFEQGEMEEVKYFIKTDRMNTFFIRNSNWADTSHEGTFVSDEYGSTGLEMIRDNEPREDIMSAIDVATDYHRKKGRNVSVLGTPEKPILLSSRSTQTNERLMEDPEFHGVETVLEEIED